MRLKSEPRVYSHVQDRRRAGPVKEKQRNQQGRLSADHEAQVGASLAISWYITFV